MTGKYNGWKNYQTWNCALWIGSDVPLYRCAVDFMRSYKGRKPYTDFINHHYVYSHETGTPDGVKWFDYRLSYSELNSMMRSLIDLK